MFWTRLLRHVGFAFCTAWLITSQAAADITPEAQGVVDRYFEVTGGREAALALRSLHTRSTIEAMNLEGTLTVWTRKPDRRAVVTELGPFVMREGFDGEQAWRTDPGSGKLVMLDGQDLENAIGNAYFDNEMWLEPDQGGGRVTLAPSEGEAAGKFIVLDVSPPRGRGRRLWFSPVSGLLERMVLKADQQTIVSHLSGYRDVDGHMVAFHNRTEIEGMPANTLIAKVDSVWANEAIPDARFVPPGATLEPVVYLQTPGVASLAFDYSARHMWLRASVNGGAMADFIFDTGASVSVLDSTYVASIQLPTMGQMQSQGAGAVGSASFAEIQTLRIEDAEGDGVEVRDLNVAVLSLSPTLAPFFWKTLAGVIGYDVISRFVSEIDFDRETLTLYDPNGFVYQGAGKAVPFTLAGTMPAVPMTIDGKYEGLFRVDVGSSATVDLHRPFVEKHDLLKKARHPVEIVSGGFGGSFTSTLLRMNQVELGSFRWEGPIVSLSGAQTGALASEDYAGNIGNGILERFICTFDYERRELHLAPSQRYRGPDPFTRAGLQLARFGDMVKVMQVIDASAAHRAGIMTGDRVLAIAGKAALDYDPEQLRVMFEEGRAGSKEVFEIERGGERKIVQVKLKDVL